MFGQKMNYPALKMTMPEHPKQKRPNLGHFPLLILKNVLEYEYRKKVRVRVLLQIQQKNNF